jgi:cation/acetate symporter
VISSSVAHDLYYRILRPQATEKQRLLVGRSVIGVAVVIAGIFGVYPPGFVSEVVAFAFGLAAASFFPAIVLGIFSRRVGTVPAIAGMVAGVVFTATYIIMTVYGGMSYWTFGISATGISPQAIGALGMVLNFAVTLGLTPFFPAPSDKVQRLIDRVREPEETTPAVEIETAMEH